MKKVISLVAGVLISLFTGTCISAQSGHIIIPSGHAHGVEKILADKQGKYLYSLESGKVIMWEIKSHDQLYSFPNTFDKIMSLSNDGTKLLVGDYCWSTVTGKLLFQVKGYSPVFSPDDASIYSFESNKVMLTDVRTQESRFVSEYIPFGMSENFMVDANHFLVTGMDGWFLYNLSEKKVEQQSKLAGFYHRGMQAMAAVEKNDSMVFREVFTSKRIGAVACKSAKAKCYPAASGKDFIIDEDIEYSSTEWTIYDGETMRMLAKFKDGGKKTTPLILSKSSPLYAAFGADILTINVAKHTVSASFKRQVARIGQEEYTALDYNYNTNMLNVIADGDVYKSISMTQLKPLRHQQLPEFSVVAFSATGDSVALFDYNNKAIIKSLPDNKTVLPSIRLTDEAATPEARNFFFDNDGTHTYYVVHNVRKQINVMKRVSTATGKTDSLFAFKGSANAFINPSKDMMAAFDEGYQYSHAKVWNLANGKLLFDKDMKEASYKYIRVSGDKKEVMIVTTTSIERYDIESKKLLSTAANQFLPEYNHYACTPDLSMLFAADAYGGLVSEKSDGTGGYDVKLHDGAITNMFFSPDAKLVYTVAEDQSIKVTKASDGKLLGTLYLFNDGKDYVFISPDGRFDGSDGGMQRMYYFQDRIKLPLASVYEQYFTPNLYQRLLNGERFDPIPDIVFKPKPTTTITYAQKQRNLQVEDDIATYNNTSGLAEITVNATAPGDVVDEIRLFHNGKIVNLATRGLFVTDNDGSDSKKYTISLLPGMNRFRAVALNGQRTESDADEIAVNYTGAAKDTVPAVANNNNGVISPVDKNATLHLVVVGINAYKNPAMSLNYALADATAFKDELEKDAKTIITNIQSHFIADADADKAGIVKALAQVQQQAKPQDVFIFYYAGHGVIAGGSKTFYLVPNNVTDLKNVDAALQENGISAKDLQQFAIGIQAQKQLFILDACQSAGAFTEMLSSNGDQQKNLAVVARATGTHWMAASGSQQFANEFSQLGHGAFTYVLLQALQGKAASNKMITVNNLKNFLQWQVPELLKKYNGSQQMPASYGYGNDFPVEMLK